MKRNKVLSIVGGLSLAVALVGCSSEPVEEPKGYDVAELDKSSDKVEVKNVKYSEEFKKYEENKKVENFINEENPLLFLMDSAKELSKSVDVKDRTRLDLILASDAGWNYYMYVGNYWSLIENKYIDEYREGKVDYNEFEANLKDVQIKYAKVVMAWEETMIHQASSQAMPEEYQALFSDTGRLLHKRQDDFNTILNYQKLNVPSDSPEQRKAFFKRLDELNFNGTKHLRDKLYDQYDKVYKGWKQKVINGEI